MTNRAHLAFSILFSAIVIGGVAWGVARVGTPGTARIQRLDRQRLDDLQTIVREIQSLCQDPDIKDRLKRELPATLEELAALARSERIRLADPQTGEPYEYAVTDGTSYELCATFVTSRDSDVEVFWNHAAGRRCFEVDALDPP